MRYCRYHCRGCGSHFVSLEAFDAHHQGRGASLVPCAWPEEVELVSATEDGVCRIGDPEHVQSGVTIWNTERLAVKERPQGWRDTRSESRA